MYVSQFSKKRDKTKQCNFKWNHQIRLDVEDSISFATGYDNFFKNKKLYACAENDDKISERNAKRSIRLTDISRYYTK